ncbi:MAG: hypothetical protein K9G49_15040 [Taibaiella sp.]|nr:hypothetical protein [Taibaiella sp.]
MTFSIEIRPLAALETIEGYDWYESQKTGLGVSFLEAMDSFYFALLKNPFTHSYFIENVRHGFLQKLPYSAVYEVFGNTIVVYSVFMISQDPAKKRIK